jgi:hypothetical protein
MKQTAVEWLEKIRQGQKEQPFDDYEWEIAFNHAKEMEKEQVIDAYKTSHISMMTAEQYYNKTFKNTDK